VKYDDSLEDGHNDGKIDASPEARQTVWSALTDQALERRLRYYLWESALKPVPYAGRVGQLIEEAQRRGKPEIADRAKKWVSQSKTAPLL